MVVAEDNTEGPTEAEAHTRLQEEVSLSSLDNKKEEEQLLIMIVDQLARFVESMVIQLSSVSSGLIRRTMWRQ